MTSAPAPTGPRRLGAAIGSGPSGREAHRERGEPASRAPPQWSSSEYSSEYSSAWACGGGGKPLASPLSPLLTPCGSSAPSETSSQADGPYVSPVVREAAEVLAARRCAEGYAVRRGGRAADGWPTQAPLNFSIFYRDSCARLATFALSSFGLGVLSAWSAVWLLLWNQFPHLYIPVFGFATVFGSAIGVAAYLERRSRDLEQGVANLLRAPSPMSYTPPEGAPPSARPQYGEYQPPPRQPPSHHPAAPPRGSTRPRPMGAVLPTPPPSPPLPTPPVARSSLQRLRDLNELDAAKLLTREEYEAKRSEILASL